MFIFGNHIKNQMMARNTNFFSHSKHTYASKAFCMFLHYASRVVANAPVHVVAFDRNVTQLTFLHQHGEKQLWKLPVLWNKEIKVNYWAIIT